MLQRCFAHTFGENALCADSKASIDNHTAVRKWFMLVYDCRVMDGPNVSAIDLRLKATVCVLALFAQCTKFQIAQWDPLCAMFVLVIESG
eukprot:5403789-Pleurochrysis_carterae.AAC.1